MTDTAEQSPVHVTRAEAGVAFTPGSDHHGVSPRRLHGQEAGVTDHLAVTRSEFAPGSRVDAGPVSGETLYVVLSGELTIEAGGRRTALSRGDSVHLPRGTVRSLRAGEAPATVLVVRAT